MGVINNYYNHVRAVMLTYPDLFVNAIQIYDHIFLTHGNSYTWECGNLVYNEMKDFVYSVKESVNLTIERNFEQLSENIKMCINNEHVTINLIEDIYNHYKNEVKEQVNRVLRIDDIMYDLSIPDDFEFSELNKYSLLANIPDDLLNYEILGEIKKFINILKINRERINDHDCFLEKAENKCMFLLKNNVDMYANSVC